MLNFIPANANNRFGSTVVVGWSRRTEDRLAHVFSGVGKTIPSQIESIYMQIVQTNFPSHNFQPNMENLAIGWGLRRWRARVFRAIMNSNSMNSQMQWMWRWRLFKINFDENQLLEKFDLNSSGCLLDSLIAVAMATSPGNWYALQKFTNYTASTGDLHTHFDQTPSQQRSRRLRHIFTILQQWLSSIFMIPCYCRRRARQYHVIGENM